MCVFAAAVACGLMLVFVVVLWLTFFVVLLLAVFVVDVGGGGCVDAVILCAVVGLVVDWFRCC